MAHSYSVDSKGNIYKNGQFVPASNYKYLEQDPYGQQALSAAKKLKSGTASGTGWSTSKGWVGGSTPSSQPSYPKPSNSTPKYNTSPAPVYNKPTSMDDVLGQLTGPLKEYLMPYEQMYRDALSQFPKYEPPSEQELAQQASQWANLQINPLLQAIDRSLEQARTAASSQRQEIEANYAGFEDTVNRMLQEAASRALESAIARGGGRSGAVEWLTNKQQAPIMEQATTEQAKKTAALNAIAQALALTEQQAGEKREQFAERLGTLEANRLAELRNLAQAQAVGNWQQVMDATRNLMQMATQAQQFGQQYSLNLLPYFELTEAQRQAQPLDWTQVMGQVPEATLPQTSSAAAAVPIRSYAAQRGASIDWDPATKEVIINGKRYSSSQLQNMGGYNQNGAWYIPESALAGLF